MNNCTTKTKKDSIIENTIEIKELEVIEMPNGVIGFPELKKYILLISCIAK